MPVANGNSLSPGQLGGILGGIVGSIFVGVVFLYFYVVKKRRGPKIAHFRFGTAFTNLQVPHAETEMIDKEEPCGAERSDRDVETGGRLRPSSENAETEQRRSDFR